MGLAAKDNVAKAANNPLGSHYTGQATKARSKKRKALTDSDSHPEIASPSKVTNSTTVDEQF